MATVFKAECHGIIEGLNTKAGLEKAQAEHGN